MSTTPSSDSDEADFEAPGMAEYIGMEDNLTQIMAGIPEPIKELSSSPPDLILQAIGYCHNMTELPWWASIALCTVLVRVAVFPLTLSSIKTTVSEPKQKPLPNPNGDEIQLLCYPLAF